MCSGANETKEEEDDEEESDVQGFLFSKLKWVAKLWLKFCIFLEPEPIFFFLIGEIYVGNYSPVVKILISFFVYILWV